MSVYLDASILVALFTADSLSSHADTLLSRKPAVIVVSDFAAIEFASAVSRRVRMKELTRHHAQIAFANFDEWIERTVQRMQMMSADVATAETFLRRLDLNLRTQDAIHIAITKRSKTTLITFDKSMATAARLLKIPVAGA